MFRSVKIDPQHGPAQSRLIRDYLNRIPNTLPLYAHFPDKAGFNELLSKDIYRDFDRSTLVSILHRQADAVQNTSAQTKRNIDRLLNKNTFTVTTGHQLCLFTGPLFFFYKILSVIRLCEELASSFPEKEFVPVYWLAGEDHDLQETDHFSLFGKTLSWKTDQKGPVGRMETSGSSEVLNELNSLAANGEFKKELSELFQRSYIEHADIRTAFRYLVNELFGKYGLIIADGDDRSFKQQAKDIFEKDIFRNIPYEKVTETDLYLKNAGYDPQVNPRVINCFLMQKGKRNRIEHKDGQFNETGTDVSYTEEELLKLINDSPELFSPNVVTRPLYQQFILPNIAYTGGPGELAYWLQYKSMFDAFCIQFPVLVPRNSFSLLGQKELLQLEAAGLSAEDLFADENDTVKKILHSRNAMPDLNDERKRIEAVYETLREKAAKEDKSLEAFVSSEMQKSMKGIENLEQKLIRAVKARSDIEINRSKKIREKILPGGELQERTVNFAEFYLRFGKSFADHIYASTDPLDFRHQLLIMP